jgi:3-oxoadipate enol-lactonase
MDRTITTSLASLHVRVRPGDPGQVPLILGHGIFLDGTVWGDVLAALPDGGTVITVDGPGHGGSEPAPRGWTLADHARALVEILDELGIPRAVLAGHSWGGMVALRAALAAPGRVAALALVNTPLTRTEGSARLGFRAQQALLRATGPSAFFARRAAAALHAPESLRRRPELVERMVARMAGRRGADLADVLRAVVLDPPGMVEEVGRVAVPVAVIAGEHDYVFPPATREAVHAAAPGAVLVVTCGGHVSPEEDPAAVAAALADLLACADREGRR